MSHASTRKSLLILGVSTLGLAVACASGPTAPRADRSTAWGYLKLVPREGTGHGSSGGAYGDRRMGGVQLVDYSKPGFAVVYVEPAAGDASDDGSAIAPGEARLGIRDGSVATRLEPAHAALASGGRVIVRNDSRSLHVVSCPATGIVRNLAPGETLEVAVPAAGEYAFFLLDVPGAASTVFAAPGAHAVVSDSGHFELEDLEPGQRRIHAWHPRLPPVSIEVSLQAGAAQRVDLEMGVGRDTPEEVDAR